MVAQAARQYGVPPQLAMSVLNAESSGNPQAVSPAGAQGLMQLMPGTSAAMGVKNPFDPAQNINGGVQYLGQLLHQFGNPQAALAAYNWGPGNVSKRGAAAAPPETQAYVSKVMAGAPGNSTQVAEAAPQQNAGAPLSAPWANALADGDGGAPSQSAPSAPWANALDAQQQPQNATPASQQQVAAPAPSFGNSVVQGMRDSLNGVEQLGVHAVQSLPSNVASFVNHMPLIGPAATMLGMVPANQVDSNIAQQEQQYAAARANAGQSGFDWGRTLGNVAATAPLSLMAPETAGMGLLGKIVTGATIGGLFGAGAPVTSGNDFWAQKAKQAALGAATGGVVTPVTSAIGGALSGAQGAAQQALAKAGVTLTPGQILGGGWKATEDKLTSIPVLGDLIKNAQQRSVQSFNKATYNQVLAPLGQTYSGPVGNEGVASVQQSIGDAYHKALSKMTFNATDPAFQSELGQIGNMAQSLPASQKQQFLNIVQNQIVGKASPQGLMTGDTLKGVQSELGRLARGYSGDASFDTRQLGAAVGAVKDAIDNSLPRYNAPEAVQGLQAANAAYANFVRLRTAAASQGAMNNGGVFTGAQLNNAVRGADKSVGKGATATGKALMQDFSTGAQSVLGNTYPDSGTTGRGILAALGGLGVGALAGHEALPMQFILPSAAAVGFGALPYTGMGQRLTQGLLMSRPQVAQAVGNAITRYGTPLAPALGAALYQGANR